MLIACGKDNVFPRVFKDLISNVIEYFLRGGASRIIIGFSEELPHRATGRGRVSPSIDSLEAQRDEPRPKPWHLPVTQQHR